MDSLRIYPFFCGLLAMTLIACGPKEKDGYAPTPKAKLTAFPFSHDPAKLQVTGPDRCASCHEEAVEEWKLSHHAKANRAVSVAKDLAAFTPTRTVEESGVTYTLSVESETFYLDVSAADKATQRYEIFGVIGETPLRQYLVRLPGNKFQTMSATYDVLNDQWFDVFAGENRQPGEWGHWTGQGMNWNANCAYCHTTDYKKNFDYAHNEYSSTWIQQGIACASCHSGLEAHLKSADKSTYDEDSMLNVTRSQTEAVCASCHSRRDQLTPDAFDPGDTFHDHFSLSLPDQPGLYHTDGQILDEVFVYGSFNMSRMHHSGVSCLDCHNPHSLKPILPVENNMLCMRCHQTGLMEAPVIEPMKHSHHSQESTGNRCVECHMPKTTYMQVDPRADHGFHLPDPLMTKELGTPNACSSCHTDQSVDWAIEWSEKWYSESASLKRQRERSRTLHLAYQMDSAAISRLTQLLNTEEIAAWKATYLGLLLNYLPNESVRATIQNYANDPSPLVRERVARALQNFEASQQIDLLSDPSRNVRIAAAREAELSGTAIPNTAFAQEWQSYLDFQMDRPQTLLIRAQAAIRNQQPTKVLEYVNRAIQMDAVNPEIYLQAAILLSQAQLNEIAQETLYTGWDYQPENPQFPYSLGLLAAESGDYTKAIGFLEETVAMAPDFYRAWYNLSLAYSRINQPEKADAAMQRARGPQ